MALKKEVDFFTVDVGYNNLPISYEEKEEAFVLHVEGDGWLWLTHDQLIEVQEAISEALAKYEVHQANARYTEAEWTALSDAERLEIINEVSKQKNESEAA